MENSSAPKQSTPDEFLAEQNEKFKQHVLQLLPDKEKAKKEPAFFKSSFFTPVARRKKKAGVVRQPSKWMGRCQEFFVVK
uniref:Uncharacterized protein n=1 Tax=Romanomermis culicivorax TaxID=13658 RepID=A0A915L6T3_ROMCU